MSNSGAGAPSPKTSAAFLRRAGCTLALVALGLVAVATALIPQLAGHARHLPLLPFDGRFALPLVAHALPLLLYRNRSSRWLPLALLLAAHALTWQVSVPINDWWGGWAARHHVLFLNAISALTLWSVHHRFPRDLDRWAHVMTWLTLGLAFVHVGRLLVASTVTDRAAVLLVPTCVMALLLAARHRSLNGLAWLSLLASATITWARAPLPAWTEDAAAVGPVVAALQALGGAALVVGLSRSRGSLTSLGVVVTSFAGSALCSTRGTELPFAIPLALLLGGLHAMTGELVARHASRAVAARLFSLVSSLLFLLAASLPLSEIVSETSRLGVLPEAALTVLTLHGLVALVPRSGAPRPKRARTLALVAVFGLVSLLFVSGRVPLAWLKVSWPLCLPLLAWAEREDDGPALRRLIVIMAMLGVIYLASPFVVAPFHSHSSWPLKLVPGRDAPEWWLSALFPQALAGLLAAARLLALRRDDRHVDWLERLAVLVVAAGGMLAANGLARWSWQGAPNLLTWGCQPLYSLGLAVACLWLARRLPRTSLLWGWRALAVLGGCLLILGPLLLGNPLWSRDVVVHGPPVLNGVLWVLCPIVGLLLVLAHASSRQGARWLATGLRSLGLITTVLLVSLEIRHVFSDVESVGRRGNATGRRLLVEELATGEIVLHVLAWCALGIGWRALSARWRNSSARRLEPAPSPRWGRLVHAASLVGLLVVAGDWLPETHHAVERAAVNRTRGRLATLSTLVETHAITHGHYPIPGSPMIPAAELGRWLESRPGAELTHDGWGHPLHYSSDGQTYRLWSRGRDGRPGGPAAWPHRGPLLTYDDDIIKSDGRLVTYHQKPSGGWWYVLY
ncbi:MAG: type II secretion system protein GspG [Acidobacteriota bacterium]